MNSLVKVRRTYFVAFGLISLTWGALVYLLFTYEFAASDVFNYWLDSLAWQMPFDAFHVPGYPWLIALVRGVVGDNWPMRIMVFINAVALVASLAIVYELLDRKVQGMLLFALWPLTGLATVANPLADTIAIAWLLGGLLALHKRRVWLAGGFLAMALLTHKIMWLFVVGVWLVWWWDTRPGRTHLLPILTSFIPLAILWLTGALHHSDPLWLVSANLGEEFASHSGLPILDGVVGTLLFQGWNGIVQGSIIFVVLGLAGYLLYQSRHLSFPRRRESIEVVDNKSLTLAIYTIAIAVPLLLLGVLLNQKEIWAVMRFGRLLILPLLWLNPHFIQIFQARKVWWVVVLLLILSQFAFMMYMVNLV